MPPMFRNGKPLMVDGKPAMDPACCCTDCLWSGEAFAYVYDIDYMNAHPGDNLPVTMHVSSTGPGSPWSQQLHLDMQLGQGWYSALIFVDDDGSPFGVGATLTFWLEYLGGYTPPIAIATRATVKSLDIHMCVNGQTVEPWSSWNTYNWDTTPIDVEVACGACE